MRRGGSPGGTFVRVNADSTAGYRPWRLIALCCLAMSTAACHVGTASAGAASSSPVPAGTTVPAADAALCGDVYALRSSVKQLANVTIAPGLANELKVDFNEVKADVQALAADAHGQWQSQTAEFSAALASFEAALSKLTASPAAGAVSAVVSARGDVNAAAQSLLAAAGVDCPSGSPSAGH
jgi:hypothetical protein